MPWSTSGEGDTDNGSPYNFSCISGLCAWGSVLHQDGTREMKHGERLKTFRITYTKSTEHIVELEASSASKAWEKIKSKTYKAVWEHEGNLVFDVKTTEEITKHIASNPK